ncbi:hypothetical protein [Chryseolinea soli]|uniref:Uncharacterized protein n=1 Tax=Chryseolinea soli TaxID=2321403 RepID=A0A385SKK0_9BACT|nr:hypothetical protein [Chryseolinea soli]AYB29940.1 hypothetical protein D4L85_04810 [Chryseolinea soli]
MKKNILFPWVDALLGVVLCFVLFGFSATSGAHNVQVYLDSKLVIDQYINQKVDAAKINLDLAENPSQLIVKYSECGRTVTGRKITLKDNDNKVLKVWEFAGSSTGAQEPMACTVKDILALKPKKSNTLKLFYSSDDFPQGQQFAYLVLSGTATTASR